MYRSHVYTISLSARNKNKEKEKKAMLGGNPKHNSNRIIIVHLSRDYTVHIKSLLLHFVRIVRCAGHSI